MTLENEQVDGAEESQSDGAESTATTDTKSDIEFLKQQNAELNQKLSAFLEAQNRTREEPKTLSKEEYSKLLAEDPKTAIEMAVADKVRAHTDQISKSLTSQQQATFYDQKAEKDFPLINTDKQFQALVKNETKALIEDGMSKDSPKLVYKAAQIAALKYKGAQDTKTEGTKSISGEAPSNVSKKNDSSRHLPKNFDRLAASFNMSEKAIARAKENFAYLAEKEAHRKGRG